MQQFIIFYHISFSECSDFIEDAKCLFARFLGIFVKHSTDDCEKIEEAESQPLEFPFLNFNELFTQQRQLIYGNYNVFQTHAHSRRKRDVATIFIGARTTIFVLS